ncbi:MAG TPA: hypothetical protein VNL77_14290 [Roseiflexaceae bacterium]|nr:hypothetical protein [Roseiflexaceae bacterium]
MRPLRWSDLFALFFDPRVPLAFLVGSLALGVAGSAAYALLTDLLGVSRQAQGGIVLGAVLVLLFATGLLRQAVLLWVARRTPGQLRVPPAEQVVPQRALVLPVGLNDPGPERRILEHHVRNATLRHCWLVVSAEVQGSAKLSNLRQWLAEQNVDAHTLKISDPFSLAESYDAASEAIRAAGVLRDALPVAVDITGGTAVMSVGLALAAREHGVEIHYYPAIYSRSGALKPGSADAPMVAAYVAPKGKGP